MHIGKQKNLIEFYIKNSFIQKNKKVISNNISDSNLLIKVQNNSFIINSNKFNIIKKFKNDFCTNDKKNNLLNNKHSYSKSKLDSSDNPINDLLEEKNIINNCVIDETKNNIQEQIVTPWEVIGKVDYMKLVNKFGTELIDDKIIERFEKITNKPIHPWVKRKIFFTHRGLNTILTAIENNKRIFLYTGRGPSSESMHLGHLIPFIFTKWLQETLNCLLVIQISDEEKYAFKKKEFSEIYCLGKNNAKDIASIGFNPNQTFIFSNRDYRISCPQYEILASNLKVYTNANEIKKIFGFTDEATIAMMDWPFYQTAAAYYQAYPNIFGGKPAHCLIPHAIDQDPYFRLARDLSTKINNLKLIKPCNIMSKFIPPLTGDSGKMSSSENVESTIFLNDSKEVIREKIFKYTYSGGGGDGTLMDHKKYGGNVDMDMAYQYLRYFELDDEKLEKIRIGFNKGEISCFEIKEILCEKITEITSVVQKNRIEITDETMKLYYDDKNKLINEDYNKNNNNLNNDNNYRIKRKITDKQTSLLSKLKSLGIDNYKINFHEHLSIKENEIDLKNIVQGNLTKTVFLKATGNDYYFYIIDYDEIIDLKIIKKKLKLKSLKYGENDTINHLFETKKEEFSLLAYLNIDDIKEKNFNLIISEKIRDAEFLNFAFISEDSHITIKNEDFKIILHNFNLNYLIV